MTATIPAQTIVVSACDDYHHALAVDLIASLNEVRDGTFKVGFVNVDDGPLCREFKNHVDVYTSMNSSFDRTKHHGFKLAHMQLKTRLPEIFPGFSVYVWLDGDTWVQNTRGIVNAARGAAKADIAIHPQLDPHYYRNKFHGDNTVARYRNIFPEAAADIWRYPMINSGVFAARADSKLWSEWKAILEETCERRAGGADIYFSDQVPLHYLMVMGKIAIHPLRAVDNWLVFEAVPSLNPRTRKLVVPTEPHEEINTVHLAAWGKKRSYKVPGVEKEIWFTYRDVKRYFAEASAASS